LVCFNVAARTWRCEKCKVVTSDSYKVTMTEPTAGPRPRAADDDMVTKRLRALSGQRGLLGCNVRDGKSSGECWCYQAGPNGETLPCPPVEVTQTIKESQTEITKEPKALPLTNLQGEITGSCPHCQTNRVPCAGHCFGC